MDRICARSLIRVFCENLVAKQGFAHTALCAEGFYCPWRAPLHTEDFSLCAQSAHAIARFTRTHCTTLFTRIMCLLLSFCGVGVFNSFFFPREMQLYLL